MVPPAAFAGVPAAAPAAARCPWVCARPAGWRAGAGVAGRAAVAARRAVVRCAAGGGDAVATGDGRLGEGEGGGDPDRSFDPDDEFAGYESVELVDGPTGRTLACVVEHEVDVGAVRYAVCAPKDDVVAFAFEKDEELVCVEDEAEVDRLFPAAAAVMGEQRVELKRTAFVLTADDTDARIVMNGGGEEEEDDDEDDVLDADEEDDDHLIDDDDDGDYDEGEDVEVLGEFCHDGSYYLVVRPEGPVLLIARRTDGGLVVADDEELDRVTPEIEAQLAALEAADA